MDGARTRWFWRWVIGGVLVCAGLLFWMAVASRGSSTLVVRVEGEWQQVTIMSDGLRSPLTFMPPGPIRVEKLEYGPYRIAIGYRDGKKLWLECYHTDAGKAKTIAVVVKRNLGADRAAVETICAYWGQSPRTDFSKEVVIDATSEQAACRVWGGP